jgi:prepilin-type N-terminal cleavage/methylation domain-containing protein
MRGCSQYDLDGVRDGLAGASPDSSRADAGFTIVEIVVTIALMAVVIIPLIRATFTMVRASSQACEVAQAETVS